MGDIKMVVGLGNPGDDYADTRHNMGFKVIDLLTEVLRIETKKRKFGACFGTGRFAGKKLILLKPWQWMNRSGQAVVKAVGFYKLALDDLLVITDDLNLEPGRIRVRVKGSAGGHNGLADIIEKLGADSFGRLRLGIGRGGEETYQSMVDYVLDRPTEVERSLLNDAIKRARDAVFCWIEYGIETVMNRFNSEKEKETRRE